MIGAVVKIFSIVVVETKVISCNSANKSCFLQVVHTKAIAALTQFCDFLFFLRTSYFKPIELRSWNTHIDFLTLWG